MYRPEFEGRCPNRVKLGEFTIRQLREPTDYEGDNGRFLTLLQLIEACEVMEQGASGVFIKSSGDALSAKAKAANHALAYDKGANSDNLTVALYSERPPACEEQLATLINLDQYRESRGQLPLPQAGL